MTALAAKAIPPTIQTGLTPLLNVTRHVADHARFGGNPETASRQRTASHCLKRVSRTCFACGYGYAW